MISPRCAQTAPDGRRCCRPAGHAEKHLLLSRTPTASSWEHVAEARGATGAVAKAAARAWADLPVQGEASVGRFIRAISGWTRPREEPADLREHN